MFTIYNTITGKKEEFKPLVPHNVSMYVCGITPYSNAHIGHGRSAVSFDLLYRWLTFLSYQVSYVRNYTDIEDKLLDKAAQQLGDPQRYREIAEQFITQYQHEIKSLNCLIPTHEPRVTENIPAIIEFIKDLIRKGYAYQVDGDVYFEVTKFPEYGKLSKQKIDELTCGTRIDVDQRKKNPLDFALWKSEDEGTYFESPWSWGRPGWHIECSVLACKFLSDQIDIHGGGRDLIFPHHENEIAQSEAHSGKLFARYWIHNGLVNIDKQKMSKSLGNTLILAELIKKYNPMLLRYYFIIHHYRTPLEFSFEGLANAKKSYNRLSLACKDIPTGNFSLQELKEMPIINIMLNFLADDLNTPGMFGALFENLDTLKEDKKQLSAAKQILITLLGLSLIPIEDAAIEITPEIQHLLNEREKARTQKNWARADEIRDQLQKLGVDIQDKKLT
jgi:cysteinyl-tRNA synthetase